MPAGEETAVGWGVLDRWLFRKHGWEAWKREHDWEIRQESGQALRKASRRPSTGVVLKIPRRLRRGCFIFFGLFFLFRPFKQKTLADPLGMRLCSSGARSPNRSFGKTRSHWLATALSPGDRVPGRFWQILSDTLKNFRWGRSFQRRIASGASGLLGR